MQILTDPQALVFFRITNLGHYRCMSSGLQQRVGVQAQLIVFQLCLAYLAATAMVFYSLRVILLIKDV